MSRQLDLHISRFVTIQSVASIVMECHGRIVGHLLFMMWKCYNLICWIWLPLAMLKCEIYSTLVAQYILMLAWYGTKVHSCWEGSLVAQYILMLAWYGTKVHSCWEGSWKILNDFHTCTLHYWYWYNISPPFVNSSHKYHHKGCASSHWLHHSLAVSLLCPADPSGMLHTMICSVGNTQLRHVQKILHLYKYIYYIHVYILNQ